MMKKITFLFILLITSFGYSQELLTNGDFQTGDGTAWSGSGGMPSVVTYDMSNYFNEANVAMAGNPWDVNLSQVLELTPNTTYTFSFNAWTGTGAMRTMIVGIGLNEDPWTAATETITLNGDDTSQSFTFTMTAPGNVNANSRVIFDMGAAVGYVGIDNVSLVEVTPTCDDGIQNGDETGVDCGGSCPNTCPPTCDDGVMNGDETGVDCGGTMCPPCSAPPTTIPTTPPGRPAADVVSIFCDEYADISVASWGPDWGPFSARINDYNIVTRIDNAVKVMDVNPTQEFAGIDFAASKFDATTFTHFHMDYYIPGPLLTGQALSIKLSNHDESVGAGETSAIQINPTPSVDGWVELDVPLDDFVSAHASGLLDRNDIAQIVITAARADTNEPVDIYIDNIYFHKNTLLGVEDNQLDVFSAYPNPSNTSWNIRSSDNTIINSIQIVDMLGKEVLSLEPNSNQAEVNAANLNSGLYFAIIKNDVGVQNIKLIKGE